VQDARILTLYNVMLIIYQV